MKRTGSTVAFLMGSKNAMKVAQFITKNKTSFTQCNLQVVANLTSGKELDGLGINVQYVQSLEDGGTEEIAKRCHNKHISAVFIINVASLFNRNWTAVKLQGLLEACASSDVNICFTEEMVSLVFGQIVANNDSSGGQNKNLPVINKAMQQALLTRYPSFDQPKDQRHRAAVAQWSHQQLQFMFESESNPYFPSTELLPLYTQPANAQPPTIPLPDSALRKCFALDERVPGFLKVVSCSLEAGIKFLTLGPGAEGIRRIWDYCQFERDFLITHHTFTNSLQLMKLLRKAYTMKQPDGVDESEYDFRPAETVLVVLSDWILMEYGSDFQDNQALVDEFEEFIREDIMKNNATTATELQQLLQTACQLSPPYPLNIETDKQPKPILPKKILKTETIQLWTLSPIEVARQMTLVDEALFHKVRAKEFLGGAWTKKTATELAPNLTAFIHHVNRMTNFVATEILSVKTKELLKEYIEFWIAVADQFRILHNYSGVMSILSALHNATISRLSLAWADVKKQDRETFEAVTESLSLLGHYKNYRERLKTIDSSVPIVPLIAVTCSDLNGLGEVLENYTPDGDINWDKHSKFAEHIWSVKRFMRARYIFQPLPAIQNYINSVPVWEGEKTLAAIAKYRDKFCQSELSKANPIFVRKQEISFEMNEKDWECLKSKTFPIVTKYSKGDVILEEGSTNKFLHRLKKGTCSNPLFGSMKDKGFFGEISLLLKAGETESITSSGVVVAQSDVEIHKYDIGWVKQQCKDAINHQLSEKLNLILSMSLANKLKNFGPGSNDLLRIVKDTSAPIPEDEESSMKTGTMSKGKKLKVDKRSMKRSASAKFHIEIPEGPQGTINGPQTERGKTTERVSLSSYSSIFKSDASVIHSYPCEISASNTESPGTLFITKENLSFYSTNFGRQIKIQMPFTKITKVEMIEQKTQIVVIFDGKRLTFKEFNEGVVIEASNLINTLFSPAELGSPSSVNIEADFDITSVMEDPTSLAPDAEDWENILSGTRSVRYAKGETVIRQDERQSQRIYQISQGRCVVEKDRTDGRGVLATLSVGSIFGEISFLDGQCASATVRADEDNTTIQIIEGYFLDVIFEYYPGLAGRFYHYLAQILFERLRQRSLTQVRRSTSESSGEEAPVKVVTPTTSSSLKVPSRGKASKEPKHKNKESKESRHPIS